MCSVDGSIALGWLCLSHPRSSEMMLVICVEGTVKLCWCFSWTITIWTWTKSELSCSAIFSVTCELKPASRPAPGPDRFSCEEKSSIGGTSESVCVIIFLHLPGIATGRTRPWDYSNPSAGRDVLTRYPTRGRCTSLKFPVNIFQVFGCQNSEENLHLILSEHSQHFWRKCFLSAIFESNNSKLLKCFLYLKTTGYLTIIFRK